MRTLILAVVVGAIAALTGLMIVLFLPLNRQEERQSPFSEIRAFNRPEIWYPLAIGSIGFAGMFCVFSYMAPTLLEVTGVNPFWIPIALGLRARRIRWQHPRRLAV